MKKLISILIVGLLFFIVTGCGSTDTATTDTTDTEKSELEQELVGEWSISNTFDTTAEDGTAETGTVTTIYTFNEDMTYTAGVEVTTGGETSEIPESSVTGTYTVKGDVLTLTVDTINGMSEDEFTAAYPDSVDEEGAGYFADTIYTIKIDNNTLTLTDDGDSYDLTKVS